MIDLLVGYGIAATGSVDAPGVYVGTSKIAALGLRSHSRRLLSWARAERRYGSQLLFHAIDPCGYPGLAVTQLRDLGVTESLELASEKLARILMDRAPVTTIGAKEKGAAKDGPHPDQGRAGRTAPKAGDKSRVRMGDGARLHEVKRLLRERELHAYARKRRVRTSANASAKALRRS